MKKRLAMLLMACAAITAASPQIAHAEVNVSANIQINAVADFSAPLTPYGSWVQVGQYGRCWHPRGVEAGWQPYTVGYWDSTDAGWYWQSDEPWAWACYHYGSWYQDPSVGWVWIPGTEWAPAWVTWRDSDDYVGWAPCGPGLAVLAPSFFVFCDIHHFHDHFSSRHDFVVNNTTIINRTRVVNNFDRRNIDVGGHQRTIFVNRGPTVANVERATGAKFTQRPVRDVFEQSHQPDNVRHDQGQRPEQRPEQRNAEPQRQVAPSPTGHEQQRNYQQQQQDQQKQQELQRQQQQKQLQQQRTPEPAVRPDQRTPQPPPERHEVTPVNPPTGRETPRVYPEVPKPAPVEPKKEVPTPPQHPVAPEKPLPPTGREEVPHTQPREVTPPPQPREVAPPAVKQAPPAQHQQPADGQKHDGDGHDGH